MSWRTLRRNVGKGIGYGKGKMKALNVRIATWKLNGWDHALFKDTIKYREEKKKTERHVGMGFVRAKKHFGGAAGLKEALESGECVVRKKGGKDMYYDSEHVVESTSNLVGERSLAVGHLTKLDASFLQTMESNIGS